MYTDVSNWLAGRPTRKRVSKETLNHPGIIELVTGLDPFEETPAAYLGAYEALGIDIINTVPEEKAPPPVTPGEVNWLKDGRVQETYLGVFNSTSRVRYPYETVEAFWEADVSALEYAGLDLPGSQYMMPCTREAIERKMALVGGIGIYYYQIYTTLFMWGVEALGWEVFMLAAGMDAERFDRHFLEPMFGKTRDILTMLSQIDTPYVFCHDDIARSVPHESTRAPTTSRRTRGESRPSTAVTIPVAMSAMLGWFRDADGQRFPSAFSVYGDKKIDFVSWDARYA